MEIGQSVAFMVHPKLLSLVLYVLNDNRAQWPQETEDAVNFLSFKKPEDANEKEAIVWEDHADRWVYFLRRLEDPKTLNLNTVLIDILNEHLTKHSWTETFFFMHMSNGRFVE